MKILKRIHAFKYISNKIGKCEQWKLMKIMYFADREHAMHYGRSITLDVFVAMENGPVLSSIYSMMTKNTTKIDSSDINMFNKNFATEYISNDSQENSKNYFISATGNVDEDELSLSDIEIMDNVINLYSHMTLNEIITYSHTLPEWHSAWISKRIGTKANTIDLSSILNSDLVEIYNEYTQYDLGTLDNH